MNRKNSLNQFSYDRRIVKVSLINYLYKNLNKKAWIEKEYVC